MRRSMSLRRLDRPCRRRVVHERVQRGIGRGVILAPILVVVAGEQLRERRIVGRGVVDRDVDIDGAVHCQRSWCLLSRRGERVG